jgi:putative surface-exposed virulence protein
VATNGRGTASLSTASGVLNFAFYVVDANQIKLVETDATPVLAGDAFRQNGTFSNATLSGPFAFTIGGANLAAPFAAGGVLTSNGAGAITSGIEDVNNGGTANTNLTLSGTYTLAANGRGTALLATGLGNVNLAFYPTTKGVQVLETDTGLIANGAAFQQTGSLSSATVSGNYAMNFTGVSAAGALDAVSQFNANGSGALSGIIDINNFGSLSTGTSITGNYSVSADGRGPLTFITGLGQQNMAIYVVDSTHAIFIDLDSTTVTLGEMDHR